MKLVLFDIDGTLVLTGGAGMRALNRAFEERYGVPNALEGVALAGRTDRAIIVDGLARVAPGTALDEGWLADFRARYCRFLEEELAHGVAVGRKEVLPGVRPLLDALAARADVGLGLLTGNFPESARIKLAHFDLWRYFKWGAFGDGHVDRNALLALARVAARDHHEVDVPPERIFVIGDTPHDVACARSGGAVAIAVASGFVSLEDLRATRPDALFEDLSDTAAVLRVIDGA
jgi:phosphoglycolate phosphatase-like HAD superfamily hydrolase